MLMNCDQQIKQKVNSDLSNMDDAVAALLMLSGGYVCYNIHQNNMTKIQTHQEMIEENHNQLQLQQQIEIQKKQQLEQMKYLEMQKIELQKQQEQILIRQQQIELQKRQQHEQQYIQQQLYQQQQLREQLKIQQQQYFNPNKSLMSPHLGGKQRTRCIINKPRIVTSSPLPGLSKEYSLPISEYDESEHNYQLKSRHQNLPQHLSPDSGNLTDTSEEPEAIKCEVLPNSSNLTYPEQNPITNPIPRMISIEFDKIERESKHNKDLFVLTEINEDPLKFEYNANKSRLRKEYNNQNLAQERARNNIASRRSRYKKKLAIKLLSLSCEFDVQENSKLFQQEKWMSKMIEELEEKVKAQNIDVSAIKKMCGIK